jgi:hypothetical protein
MISCNNNEDGIRFDGDVEEICDDFTNLVFFLANALEEIIGKSGSIGLMMDLFNFGMQQFINPDEDDENEEGICSEVTDDISH